MAQTSDTYVALCHRCGDRVFSPSREFACGCGARFAAAWRDLPAPATQPEP